MTDYGQIVKQLGFKILRRISIYLYVYRLATVLQVGATDKEMY